MENLSFFERAGFDKDTARKLEEICCNCNIPFDSLLSVIREFKPNKFLAQKEIDKILDVVNCR